MRAILVSAVKSAFQFATAEEEAGSALPFASVAVMLCKDMASRIHVLKENKEVVTVLVEVSASGRCRAAFGAGRAAEARVDHGFRLPLPSYCTSLLSLLIICFCRDDSRAIPDYYSYSTRPPDSLSSVTA